MELDGEGTLAKTTNTETFAQRTGRAKVTHAGTRPKWPPRTGLGRLITLELTIGQLGERKRTFQMFC